ncbi:hypothetical protein QE152_g9545 [Popillia japonica]|uniref:Secreted protein n=1 Tax=Popillia japonica TaxID=7064 RepID=A0AAW1LYF5_POPJA
MEGIVFFLLRLSIVLCGCSTYSALSAFVPKFLYFKKFVDEKVVLELCRRYRFTIAEGLFLFLRKRLSQVIAKLLELKLPFKKYYAGMQI